MTATPPLLAVPLCADQVEAAARLQDRVDGWRRADSALSRLHRQCPGFGSDETLLIPGKTVGDAVRRQRSFASKFAHFFIDAERFPILDRFADQMVQLHLGRRLTKRDPCHHYAAFCENFANVARFAGVVGQCRQLDRYLWVFGQFCAWKKGDATVNTELRALFESNPPDLKIATSTVLAVLTSPCTSRG